MLYHGTSETVAKLVQQKGLLPRRLHRGKHNWKHAFEGNRETVYLTDAYPVTYAVEAVDNVITRTGQQERLAIIEIDSDRLDEANFVPDEDVLEQGLRGRDDLSAEWTMLRRCRYYKTRLRQHASQWQWSLSLLGTCGYMGVIPPTAIRRIALIDYVKSAHAVMFALDAIIVLANYRIVGLQHKAITAWFFGDPLPELTETQEFLHRDAITKIATLPRDGIEVIDLSGE